MPQALQSGVPSSASLQSGVLWVLQEAHRLGPRGSEVKSQRPEVNSRGLCRAENLVAVVGGGEVLLKL